MMIAETTMVQFRVPALAPYDIAIEKFDLDLARKHRDNNGNWLSHQRRLTERGFTRGVYAFERSALLLSANTDELQEIVAQTYSVSGFTVGSRDNGEWDDEAMYISPDGNVISFFKSPRWEPAVQSYGIESMAFSRKEEFPFRSSRKLLPLSQFEQQNPEAALYLFSRRYNEINPTILHVGGTEINIIELPRRGELSLMSRSGLSIFAVPSSCVSSTDEDDFGQSRGVKVDYN